MKFDERTLSILKNYTGINNSLYIKQGNVISTINQGKSLLAKANVSCNFDKSFAIYDLNRFLSTYSLFNSPEITLFDEYLEIKDKNKSVKYVYCSPDFILNPPDSSLDIEEGDYEFKIESADLQTLLKATAVMKFPNIEFVGNGSTLIMKSLDVKNPTGDDFSIELGSTDKVFNAVFKTELFRMILDTYEVKIIGKGIAQFTASDIIYWIAVERNLSFL